MNSDKIKQGDERAPHRSLLRATGIKSDDFGKPFIAICNSYNQTIPGHVHLNKVADIIKAEITALELNEDAVKLAQENFKNSPFSERLQVFHQDFKTFASQKEYDFVVCNPPFFEENNSVKDILARQQVELTFRILIEKASKILSSEGIFSVIIPSESAQEFENLAQDFDLHLVRKVNIFGIENGVLKRNVLEFSKKKSALETLDFTIEKSPRKYSDQYLELTKEFHVFGK